MRKDNCFLSTIDPRAGETARALGLGLEIAEFATASNMDGQWPEVFGQVERAIEGVERRLFHGPFNELFPCAIDPRARELAAARFRQALDMAEGYHAQKVIFHGGFLPHVYYPSWYAEQSAAFWRDFLDQWQGSTTIVLENVLEADPRWMRDVIEAVDDPRLRLCLDVGHANVYSKVPVSQWIETLAPFLSHFHLHNNPGTVDAHNPLFRGTIDMEAVLTQIDALCPRATCTLEVIDGAADIPFLRTLR